MPLEDVLHESGSVRILEDLPIPPKPIELSSNDEKLERSLEGDPEEDKEPKEEEEAEEDLAKNLKMGQQGIRDVDSFVSSKARVVVLTQVMSLRMSLIQTVIPFKIRMVGSSFLSLSCLV